MYKRLHLRLDKDIADALEGYAAKSGNTKSNIIRDWIDNDADLQLPLRIPRTQSKSSYTLRLSSDTSQRMMLLAEEYSLSLNDLINRIVYSKLAGVGIRPSTKELWNRGLYKELSATMGEDLEKMSVNELILYSDTHLHLGEFHKTRQALDCSESRIANERRPELELGYVYKMRTELAIYERRIHDALALMEKGLEIAFRFKDRKLIGTLLAEKAKYYFAQEKAPLAFQHFHDALDYLDIFNHADDVTRIYMWMIDLHIFDSNQKGIDLFMRKLKQLVKMTGNHRHYANYCSQAGNHITQRTLQPRAKVNKYFESSIKQAKISGTVFGLRNFYEAYGFSRLAETNYYESYQLLSSAEEIERKHIPNKKFRKSTFCKHFIEAKDNYFAADVKLNRLVESVDRAVAPNFTKYIIGSTKYVYGPDSTTRKQGEIILKEVSANAAFASHRRGAIVTLNNKILSVV